MSESQLIEHKESWHDNGFVCALLVGLMWA